ncbi:hypothetical protein N9X11_01605 [Candidatus Pelagibacter bacterium]|jgi:hypothetical protein|nr:hypothetical protein [Candidatus Pelagibacter bacterium]|tara:strand:+ start:102 stop:572 length:471 start_codon:yes stop_codon:yes gene_type:complete
MKEWKIIKQIKLNNSVDLIKALKKKGFKTSPWIDDIFLNKNFKNKKIKLPMILYRVSLKDLGIKKPTELNKVYKISKKKGFKLVNPLFALICRELYLEQPTGEWLRFATPFNSMIDSDGVSHLPKLGKALNLYFIETYWSYPKAVFHPHNEFVFSR